MAITATNLDSGIDSSGAITSKNTNSITPSANKLILCMVASRRGDSVNPVSPTLTGCNLTWVSINSTVYDNSSTSRRTVTLYRAMGLSPTTGAVTIDFGANSQTDVTWAIDQITGADTSGTNGSGAIVQNVVNQDRTETATSLTATLGAFSSTANATYGACASDGADTMTVGSGFTQLGRAGTNLNGESCLTEFNSANDTTVDFTTGAVNNLGLVAIEIKASSTITVKTLAALGVG